uniref:Uncharacterized protein n=1 Tax=Setaria viridis TaxID=4556 RepID=A0A4U6W6E6_SETVI|nr:hypothetical protein SEVIR_1G042500v2 [Setaria viridis]
MSLSCAFSKQRARSQPAGEPRPPTRSCSPPEKYTSFLAFQGTGPMECQIHQSLTPVQAANALAMAALHIFTRNGGHTAQVAIEMIHQQATALTCGRDWCA